MNPGKQELIELIKSSTSLVEGTGDSPLDYLRELRRNRESFIDELRSRALLQSRVLPDSECRRLRTVTKNIQNSTRGKLGELLGRVHLSTTKQASDDSILTDKRVFTTPYGLRRIDVYWIKDRVALETKMGYIYNSKSIRGQIQKDRYLLNTGQLASVTWLLIKGGSAPVRNKLRENGIEVLEGWPL